MNQIRRKYVPNLKRMQAVCDANYASLITLLPEIDEQDMTYRFDDGKRLAYCIEIVECARFTTTVKIQQDNAGLPAYMQPSMRVRLYHDVRMAEVLESQNTSAFRASYPYPNKRMMQKNEKEMINLFLHEWLTYCRQFQGSSSQVD